MTDKYLPRARARLSAVLCACACLLAWSLCGAYVARAATPTGSPVLLSDPASTRAIALESVTFTREPFPVSSNIDWNGDRRTRIMLFAMNLDFLAGEGANALTVDAEDSTGRHYSLAVEYVGKVRAQEWMYAVVVRLNDEMTDALGDVLVQLSMHGMGSNRVRVGIGTTGGGLADDPGATPTAAPSTPPPPTPTPTPKAYAAGEASTADTVRFLEQASWGATPAEITRVQSIGLRSYLNEQFNTPASSYPVLPLMPTDNAQGCPTSNASDPTYNQNVCLRMNYQMYPLQVKFFKNAMYQPDQLRQRVAFALHQILVVSGRDIDQPSWMSPYLQTLDRNAFGNFRQLLQEITLNPAMGRYLDTVGNTRFNPNENFAREILQLFSVGLDLLNPDGTPRLDAQGNRIPTYDQSTVTNFARVFTGWNFALPPPGSAQGVVNYLDPLVVRNENNHDTGAKTLLGGVTLPAGQNSSQDLNAALDNIFNHPNVAPFIGKQLIQHLVTSNPSPAYVGRVAAAFNNNCAALYPDNCTGARGDLKAVVRAVLLDPEARGDVKTDPNYGKLREPAQLVNNMLRAFNARSFDKTTTSDGSFNRDNILSNLDQDIFRPPTVFSYYPPDYQVPGTKLLGPAFGILSTSTSLRRANFVNTIVYTGITRSVPNPNTTPPTPNADPGSAPDGTSLDLSALQALAAQPDQLVAELDRLLMHGTMSPAMRAAVTQAVSSVTASNPITSAQSLKRAQMALYLVASSSQYQVER